MLAVPEEVWLEIIRHLPDSNLRQLYTLNRLFLEAYVKEKYGQLEIGELLYRFRGHRALKYLEHLDQPYISSRVTHLVLLLDHELQSAPVCVEILKFVSKVDPRHTLGHLLGHATVGDFFHPHPARRIGKPLVQLLRRLRNITTLTANVRYDGDHKHNLIIMGFTWMRFASNLSTLNLTGSFEATLNILRSAPALDSLTTLSIRFEKFPKALRTSSTNIEWGERAAPFAAFIRRCPQLHSLALESEVSDVFQALAAAVLSSIGSIPKLSHLSIRGRNLKEIDDHLPDISAFISCHAHQLSHLILPPFPATIQHWSLDEPALNLPCRLVRLAFSVSAKFVPEDEQVGMIPLYLRSTHRTLTHLGLEASFYTFDTIHSLLQPFSTSLSQHLLSLQLRSATLTPALVDYLSRTLISLKELYLEVLFIVPDHVMGEHNGRYSVSDYTGFRKGIKGRVYDTWYLANLSIRLSRHSGDPPPKWQEVLKAAIPSLEACSFTVVSTV